jgi:cathepsin L
MKAVLLLLICTVAVLAQLRNDRVEFVRWASTQGKTYSSSEMHARYAIWRKNVDFINAWNKRNTTTVLAMNAFGDMSNTEFAKYYLGLKKTAPSHATSTITARAGLPDSWDWVKQGAVTPVKNQQQCGSCWSFSTTGSVEGCHFIATKNLVSLSEQNLMDCSYTQGNQGCDGGLMTQAMDYIISNGGIDTESSYPYTAADGTCNYNAANSGSTLSAYSNVASGDESALQNSVYQGPTSIAIDASQSSFQFYSSGVYSDPSCSSSQLDHGVLAVGWGHDSSSNQDYWIVKNSWGSDWGQQGYIWMLRGSNECGVATMATLPNGCH